VRIRAPGVSQLIRVFDGRGAERDAAAEATMTLTEVLLTEAESTYAIVGRLFRRLSDDELSWTPPTGKSWMTVGQLLMHCASFGCGKAVQGLVTGNWGPGVDDSTDRDHVPPAETLPSVTSVAQALELLAADRELAVGCIQAAREARLLQSSIPPPWGGPEMCLFQQLLRMIAHLAQHKGQLFYYLKLMGKDVKTADLWGV
jgi:uncharacterized damage-inducible protein DinB